MQSFYYYFSIIYIYILQGMFFCIMFAIIFSKILFGVRYIDDISSIIISLFINAGLLLKAYTNKIKCDSYLTSIGLTKIKIMDKGMEIEGEDDEDDEEEEEVFINENDEEIITEKT